MLTSFGVVAVVAVVVLGVAQAMMLAVLLSVVAAVRRVSKSRVAVLGKLYGTPEHHVLTRSLGFNAGFRLALFRARQTLFNLARLLRL